MPTLAQLQDEPYWRAEVVTPAMSWLATRLCARYNRPAYAAGVKGDEFHLRGAHRSRSWILRSVYCTNRSYTVTHPDDLAGDENWCAGLDFNPGSTETLVAICRRLDAAARAGRIEEVSEWYGNVDGDAVVDGWNNVLNRAATSDSSHLWHLHVTVKRRWANDAAVMQRLYEILTGDEMLQDERTAVLNTYRAQQYMDGRLHAITFGLDEVADHSAFLSDGEPVWIVQQVKAIAAKVAALAAPAPAPVDVEALAAALKPHIEAAAEAAVRKVLGSVDE